ncbi:MAG: rRNA maturation RNase YbeY [Candidatus Acidiferrales bacterium]
MLPRIPAIPPRTIAGNNGSPHDAILARSKTPRMMILNRQRHVRLAIRGLEKFLARARRHLRLPVDSLTVAFVTDSEIAKWNRAYRGKNRPTDVLSFSSDDHPRNGKPEMKRYDASAHGAAAYLGDIAIAPAIARRNARRFGRTLDQEMRILILHGLLHLMGYDHETDRGQMDRRERRLRRDLGLA